MDSKELKRNLEILKYNPRKHKNIDEALTDILNSDEYAPILNGVINNKKYIYEIQRIMTAYNNIKDIPQNEIDSIYESKKVMLETKEKIDGNEVIFYLDNGNYHLAHKNSSGEYQDKLTFKQQDYIDVSNDCDSIICTKKNGCTIYNFNGDKIFSGLKEIDFIICQKLIVLKDVNENKDKFCIVDMNGNTLKLSMNVDRDKRVYDFIKKLYENYVKKDNVENLISLFNNLLNGVYPEYLYDMSYDIVKIVNEKYIYCTKGNEKCYFELLGSKIISTENYEYCDLPNNKKYNDSSIIVVCKYDMNFDKKYGLYDLDSQSEIIDCRFDYVYDWSSSSTIAYNKIDGDIIPSLIIEDEYGKINIIDDVKNLIFLKHYSGYIESLYKISKSVYNENYYEFMIIPRKVKKLTNNLYLVQNYADGAWCSEINFSLVRNLTSNPEVIFTIDNSLIYDSFSLEGYILYFREGKTYAVDYNGNIFELTVDFLLKNIEKSTIHPLIKNSINSLMLESNLPNSAFLLPSIKNANLISKENFQLSLYQKQEIISSVESSFQLVPVKTKQDNQIKLLPDTDELNFENKLINNFIDGGKFVCVNLNKVQNINKQSNFSSNSKNIEETIYVSKSSKKVIRQNNFEVIRTYDKYICIEVKYGNGKKQYLLEDNSTLIIGPFDKVVDYCNNIFIIQDKNRCQCYKEGIPITHAVDDITFIPKKIVLSDGTIEKSSYILKIENAGCLYVVDIDGDITLRKNGIVENLERLMGETNETKQKKLSKSLK